MAKGDSEQLPGTWEGVEASVGHDGSLYVIHQGTLYRVAPDGQHTELTGGWRGVRVFGVAGGRLVAIESTGKLYAADPATGVPEELAGRWDDPRAGVGLGDRLFALDGSTLYRVDPASGEFEQLTGGWGQGCLLAAAGDSLYAIEANGTLYRASPEDGRHEEVQPGWRGARAMVGLADGRVIILEEAGAMMAVNPADGSHDQIGQARWEAGVLAAVGDKVMAIDSQSRLHLVDVG